MLEILEDVKRSAISNVGKERNQVSILGLAMVIRGYEKVIADPEAPYEKFRFREELGYLYGLIDKELIKPISLTQNIDSLIRKKANIEAKKSTLSDLRVILGDESLNRFCRKYGYPVITLRDVNTKAWLWFCFIVIFIIFVAAVISFL